MGVDTFSRIRITKFVTHRNPSLETGVAVYMHCRYFYIGNWGVFLELRWGTSEVEMLSGIVSTAMGVSQSAAINGITPEIHSDFHHP